MGKQRRTVSVKTCSGGGASVVRVPASRRDDVLLEGRGDEVSAEHELIGDRYWDGRAIVTGKLPVSLPFGATSERAWDAPITLDWRSLAESGTLGGVRLA